MDAHQDSDLIDDRELSFLIGVIALAFPWFVMAGLCPEGQAVTGYCHDQPSLSAYYGCTGFTRNFFVGALTAIGVFLWSYRGFRNEDESRHWTCVFGPLAGVAAVGVAFFPVIYHRNIHYSFAIILFALLVLLAVQFAIHNPGPLRWLFALCALAIAGSVAAAGYLGFVKNCPIRYAETSAVEFFGLVWLLNTKLHQSRLLRQGGARLIASIGKLRSWLQTIF